MEKGKTLSVDFVGKITRPFFIYSLPARFLFHTGWNTDKYMLNATLYAWASLEEQQHSLWWARGLTSVPQKAHKRQRNGYFRVPMLDLHLDWASLKLEPLPGVVRQANSLRWGRNLVSFNLVDVCSIYVVYVLK